MSLGRVVENTRHAEMFRGGPRGVARGVLIIRARALRPPCTHALLNGESPVFVGAGKTPLSISLLVLSQTSTGKVSTTRVQKRTLVHAHDKV